MHKFILDVIFYSTVCFSISQFGYELTVNRILMSRCCVRNRDLLKYLQRKRGKVLKLIDKNIIRKHSWSEGLKYNLKDEIGNFQSLYCIKWWPCTCVFIDHRLLGINVSLDSPQENKTHIGSINLIDGSVLQIFFCSLSLNKLVSNNVIRCCFTIFPP